MSLKAMGLHGLCMTLLYMTLRRRTAGETAHMGLCFLYMNFLFQVVHTDIFDDFPDQQGRLHRAARYYIASSGTAA